jgi:hypothetical protein
MIFCCQACSFLSDGCREVKRSGLKSCAKLHHAWATSSRRTWHVVALVRCTGTRIRWERLPPAWPTTQGALCLKKRHTSRPVRLLLQDVGPRNRLHFHYIV